jgi:hypothetical protein
VRGAAPTHADDEEGRACSRSLVGGGIAVSPFAATWGKIPKLGIAPSSSSERNPAFAASPSRFTSNNTAWVSPASWPVGLSPLPVRGYRPNGPGRSPHDRSNLSPLQAPDKIPLDRLPPQPFDFGKRLIGGGSHRGSSILLLFLRESGEPHQFCRPDGGKPPSTVQIAKTHAGPARKRTDYSHRLNHQPADPSRLISHS